jgi:potassium efflux system protein
MTRARATAFVLLLAALMAAPAASPRAQPGDLVAAIASENTELASRIAAEEAALARERAERARLQAQREDLEARLQRIARHAELGAAGREFAVMVRREMGALPRPEQIAAEARQRERTREATSDASVRAENEALALADLEAAIERRSAAAPAAADPPQPVPDQSSVRDRALEQRNLLERLHGITRDRQETLRDIGLAEADLVQRSATAREELTRQLFWLPSPPERRLIADLAPSIAWMTSGAQWQAAAAALLDGARRVPFLTGTLGLVAVVLLALRARLRHRLAALAVHATYDMDSRTIAALKTLAVTLALAAPVSLLCWGAGSLLASSTALPPFALALGVALEVTARLLFALTTCVWLFDRHGLAASHFGWDEASVVHAGRALRRFTAVFMPLILLAALNGLEHAPYGNRETLARLLFAAAMVVLAILLVRLFRRTGPLMRRLAERSPHARAMRLYPAWLWALLFFPLGMLALAMAGYPTAAGYFFGRTMLTQFLVVTAVVVFGLAALSMQVRHRRLERSRQAQAAAPSASLATAGPGDESIAVLPPKIDLATMGEQTRSLLETTLTVSLVAGVWWIWKDAVPALSTIGDVALWSSSGGKGPAVTAVTLSQLAFAIVIVSLTWVAVRNVGALLDTLLLQRLEFQADANYAIKVVSRYAITAVGVLLASDRLGIAWSDAQWLIAALGVGLGFGLQEIVANFVSGLIVLAERPIRIGDVVTVSGVTGTVSSIRARSTRVIDADNKEVIIPNKAFITEHVVNWTLSNQVTRLLLKVGVAYGSDIARVQELLLDVVRSNPDVQSSPPASVYCVGLARSSVSIEIRAFVDSYHKRLRVQHEVYLAIERVLRDNGIEIPLQLRELSVRAAPGAGLSVPAGDPGAAGPRPHPA